MIIVIDSNEYINYFNKKTLLLEKVLENKGLLINIHESIAKEVLKNINEMSKKEFYNLLFRNNIVIETKKMSLQLFDKYRNKGLKKGDIAIAAFCEYINADFLITEKGMIENNDYVKFV